MIAGHCGPQRPPAKSATQGGLDKHPLSVPTRKITKTEPQHEAVGKQALRMNPKGNSVRTEEVSDNFLEELTVTGTCSSPCPFLKKH